MRIFLSDLFESRRGQTFGVNLAAGNAGSAAAGGLAVAVLAVAAWQRAFLPVIILQSVVFALLFQFSHEPIAIRPVALNLQGTGGRLLGAPTVRRLLVAFAFFGIAWQGTVGFLPTYFQAVLGFDPAVAGVEYALLFLVDIPVMPLSGRLGDRRSGLAVGLGALLVSLAGFLGLLVAPTGIVALVSVAILAAGMMAFPPVMQSYAGPAACLLASAVVVMNLRYR